MRGQATKGVSDTGEVPAVSPAAPGMFLLFANLGVHQKMLL